MKAELKGTPVNIVCNLQDQNLLSLLNQLKLIDYTLHVPSRYAVRHGLPRFLETDYKKGDIGPRELARLHVKHARPGDVVIAPDVLFEKKATVIRLHEYMQEMDQIGNRDEIQILMAPQGKNAEEWLECLDVIQKDADIIGIPYGITKIVTSEKKRRNGVRYPDYQRIKEMLNEVKKPYHLLGWSPTYHQNVRDIFIGAFSIDSKSALQDLFRFNKWIILMADGTWKVENIREYYRLPVEARIIQFFYYLRAWLDPSVKFHAENHLERWMK